MNGVKLLRPALVRAAACFFGAWLTVCLMLGQTRAQQPVAPAAPSAKSKTKAVIPFEVLPTNHMLVKARINGKGPYHLVFDLGAPITLLNNRASEGSGVIKAGAPRSILFGMRGEAEIEKLEVGDLTVNKLAVVIFDHPFLSVLEKLANRPVQRADRLYLFCPVQDDNRLSRAPDDFRADRLSGP